MTNLTDEQIVELRAGDERYSHHEPTWRQLDEMLGGHPRGADAILDGELPPDLLAYFITHVNQDALRVRWHERYAGSGEKPNARS